MNPRSLYFPAVGAFLLGLLCQAACHPQEPAQEDFVTSVGHVNCFLEGFTEADPEGFIEQITEPFVVRQIKGKIVDLEGNTIWFKDHPPLLEIRAFKVLIGKPLHGVYVDKNGGFEMEGVPDGPYCFKATMDGWRSVIGIIVVNKKADPKKTIILKLLPGN
jgi:hypothetical protein